MDIPTKSFEMKFNTSVTYFTYLSLSSEISFDRISFVIYLQIKIQFFYPRIFILIDTLGIQLYKAENTQIAKTIEPISVLKAL